MDEVEIYFEANSPTELKEFGFSKDGKSQHVQISLALIVTEAGMPIGYEIFKGNSFEGSTLIPTLNKLKQQYQIEEVTIVADSAMLSQNNIEALIKHQYQFIVAAKIKNMTAKITKQMLDDEGYINITDSHTNISNMRYKSIALDQTRKLITVFSEDRKRKDEYDRSKALQKIKKLEGKSSKTGLRGALKKSYIRVNKDSIIAIDEDKIECSKKFDGYFGFISNTNLSPVEIIGQYRGLWQVEQSFRITKHNLKIRPVYHYVDRRIKAHFAICYLSLAVIRSLEYKLKVVGSYMPIEELHYYLNQIKEVRLVVSGIESSIITDIPQQVRQIFMALKLDLPKRYRVKSRV